MATYFVRPDASHGGANDGTSYADAWQGYSSINWTTLRGDVNTIYVCGTHGRWQILSKTNNGNLTTARGDYPGDPGVIDGDTLQSIQQNNTDDILYKNLTLTSASNDIAYVYGGSSNITFENCVFIDGSRAIFYTTILAAREMTGLTVRDCTVYGQSSNGIQIQCDNAVTQDISDITISGCEVYNLGGRGIILSSNATDSAVHTALIENTSVHDCGVIQELNGVSIRTTATGVLTTTPEAIKPYGVIVDNCTFYGNGYVGIEFSATTNTNNQPCILRNSLIYDNCQGATLDAGNVENIGCKGLIVEDCEIHTFVAPSQFDGVGLWMDLTFSAANALAPTECIYQRNKIYNHTFDTSFSAWDAVESNTNIGGPGIHILGGNNNKVIGNVIYGNTTGIQLRVHDNSSQTPSGNEIVNNTFVNNTVVGIALIDIDDTTNIIENNIFYGGEYGLLDTSAWADEEWGGANGYATKTISNNNFFGQSIGAIAGATGITNTDPVTTDPQLDSNYNLSTTSACLAAGVKWWTGPNPSGYNGEPFSDFDTDIGANQSTHSPFHPVNL